MQSAHAQLPVVARNKENRINLSPGRRNLHMLVEIQKKNVTKYTCAMLKPLVYMYFLDCIGYDGLLYGTAGNNILFAGSNRSHSFNIPYITGRTSSSNLPRAEKQLHTKMQPRISFRLTLPT